MLRILPERRQLRRPDYYPFDLIAAPGGEVRPADDPGRLGVTNTGADEYVSRAAPLRNVALTAPCFHSGKVWDPKDAVAIMWNAQPGTAEVGDIVAFLHMLTGEQPRITLPILPVRGSDTPQPSAVVDTEVAPPAQQSEDALD